MTIKSVFYKIARFIISKTDKSLSFRLTPFKQASKTDKKIKTVSPHIKWLTRNRPLDVNASDLVVVCLVRNGATQIRHFIEHHIQLGAKHIVILDNGSTDNTTQIAMNYGDKVTVISCELPYNAHNLSLRAWLVTRFGQGCWCLVVDIDERFVYPFSEKISLAEFLNYLNLHNFSSVVTQMVDLFPGGDISTWPPPQDREKECIWYDFSYIRQHTFEPVTQFLGHNKQSSNRIKLFTGGIRQSAFGVERLISKQALFFPSRGARFATPHWTLSARVADLSCALLHYPFDNTFQVRCEEIVERVSHWKNSGEYKMYLKKLTETGDKFTLKMDTAKQFINLDQLIEDGHLIVSETYLHYIDELQKQGLE